MTCKLHYLSISFILFTSTIFGQVNKTFEEYWNQGKAEITSYELSQARYGELRNGKAVLIFVTEPFSETLQVKKNLATKENSISVLKLNSVKKFNTGIYPYSIMNSIFYVLDKRKNAIKVSSSIQDWCGHVYTQLNNREKYEITSHSYFEEEGGDKTFTLEKDYLEDAIWTQIRVNYKQLPQGIFRMIPSLEYSKYLVTGLKASEALGQLSEKEGFIYYDLTYPELHRSIQIKIQKKFPHQILEWSETYRSGFDKKAKTLTTTAKKIKTINIDYWNKHNNKDEYLRKELGL